MQRATLRQRTAARQAVEAAEQGEAKLRLREARLEGGPPRLRSDGLMVEGEEYNAKE